MQVAFAAELVEWRGPAPYHFLAVPPQGCEDLREAAALVSYGWGMVPVTATVGATTWTTSLWPRDGGYVLPVKDRVRTAERMALGGRVAVRLDVAV